MTKISEYETEFYRYLFDNYMHYILKGFSKEDDYISEFAFYLYAKYGHIINMCSILKDKLLWIKEK